MIYAIIAVAGIGIGLVCGLFLAARVGTAAERLEKGDRR